MNAKLNGRIDIIDALRGFSLAGIVIVHMVEQYVGGPAPEELSISAHQSVLDNVVDAIVFFIIRGKFFALFSLLFGLSFFIQFDNADKRGTDYRLRYLWRMLILFAIGYMHHLFYRGDILTIYAVLAPFLLPFQRLNAKWLLVGFAIIFLGIPRVLLFYIFGENPLFYPVEMDPNSPGTLATYETLKHGNFFEIAAKNAGEGFLMKMEFQLSAFYRFYLTFAFFLLGAWLGRKGYFKDTLKFQSHTRKALIISSIAFLVFGVAMGLAFSQTGGVFNLGNGWFVVGMHLMDLTNLCLTVVIVTVFVYAYQSAGGQKFLGKFIPYGKTALTNYVLQSVIGTGILYGWGLGYIGEWANSALFGLSIAIIIVQIVLSRWWLKHFRYGPFEWLWRSMTFFKWMPLRRTE